MTTEEVGNRGAGFINSDSANITLFEIKITNSGRGYSQCQTIACFYNFPNYGHFILLSCLVDQ